MDNKDNIKFIKLRGRPPKRIRVTRFDYIMLQKFGELKIGGYLLRWEGA